MKAGVAEEIWSEVTRAAKFSRASGHLKNFGIYSEGDGKLGFCR